MQFTDLGQGAHLELLQTHHAIEIFQLIDKNRAHLREWLPFIDGTQSVEDTKRFREAGAQRYARDGSFDAGIFDGEKLAGVIGLHWIHAGNRSTSLGYWLGSDFQSRGLMTRSVNAVLEHCFTELNLNRVSSAAAVQNVRSNAVLLRCGFQLEGISREPEWLYDHFVDHNLYGVLQRDWRAARGESDEDSTKPENAQAIPAEVATMRHAFHGHRDSPPFGANRVHQSNHSTSRIPSQLEWLGGPRD